MTFEWKTDHESTKHGKISSCSRMENSCNIYNVYRYAMNNLHTSQVFPARCPRTYYSNTSAHYNDNLIILHI